MFKTVASFDLWLYRKSKSKPAAEVTIYLFGSSSSKLTYLSVFSTFTLVFQHFKVPNLSGSDFTVWKFHDFTVTQILRESNLGILEVQNLPKSKFRVSKTAENICFEDSNMAKIDFTKI